MALSFLITLVVAAAPAVCREPDLAWQYEAMSNLYAPPVVADISPAPGLETLICDSEAKILRCISAAGTQLWEFHGNWAKRLVALPALSGPCADGVRRIAVANGDGALTCLNAETGKALWRDEPGPVEWGGPLWMPGTPGMDPVLVVPTVSRGVHAYEAGGLPLWKLEATRAIPPLLIRGGMAAADVDGDGHAELFGTSAFGIFRVSYSGELVYEQYTGDDFQGGVTLADADRDRKAELYAVSGYDDFLWSFDAATGNARWKAPLYAGVDAYSAAAPAVGDIDGDGQEDIVTGDSAGHVYAFSPDGVLLWSFQTLLPTHMSVSLGDVTGDGYVDILAASGDHFLYCLDARGRLQWRYGTDLRLIAPPTLDDVDLDGKTDILLCGSDRKLRCLATDARYNVQTMPWPSRRYDSAQTGAVFGDGKERQRHVLLKEELSLNGEFERCKIKKGLEQFDENSPFYSKVTSRPNGWRMITSGDIRWAMSGDKVHGGSRSLFVGGAGTVQSEFVSVQTGWRKVSAVVYRNGGDGRASLQWFGDHGLLRQDELAPAREEDGWTGMACSDSVPPPGARYLAVALESKGPGLYWDSLAVDAAVEAPARFEVLVNQVGYDVGGPKRFIVQSNFEAAEAHYKILDGQGKVSREGPLENPARITGHFGQDWGNAYYGCAFSDLDTPGKHRVHVTLDGLPGDSWPFEIGENRLWRATARAAYRFFYYQRCGMAIPGFHGPCHLDDATGPDGTGQYPLWGGWHDAGDYNKYQNAPYVYGLACAYGRQKSLFDALGEMPSGFSEFLEEILWGGDHVRRMVMEDGSAFGSITSGYGYFGPPELETDNEPGTGDERPGACVSGDNSDAHQAALARILVFLDGKDAMDTPWNVWKETAERALDNALRQGRRGLLQLSTALDLYACTRESRHAETARALRAELYPESGVPDPSMTHVEVARRWDAVFGEGLAETLKEAVVRKADGMLRNAANPFGVYTMGPSEQPNFFGTPADKGGWHVGTNSYLLENAAFMAMACQYESRPEFLDFIYNQFNWVLGLNPFNISLMEGAGSAFAPSYHHRYTFSGVARGAVPGGVVNGITWRDFGDDRPGFDLSGKDIPAYESNEVWLPHNTNYLNALAQLAAARGQASP